MGRFTGGPLNRHGERAGPQRSLHFSPQIATQSLLSAAGSSAPAPQSPGRTPTSRGEPEPALPLPAQAAPRARGTALPSPRRRHWKSGGRAARGGNWGLTWPGPAARVPPGPSLTGPRGAGHRERTPRGGARAARTHKDSRCLSCCSCCASCRRRFCSRRRCSSCSADSRGRRAPSRPGREDIAAGAAEATRGAPEAAQVAEAAKTALPPRRARPAPQRPLPPSARAGPAVSAEASRSPPPARPAGHLPVPRPQARARSAVAPRLACGCRRSEGVPWRRPRGGRRRPAGQPGSPSPRRPGAGAR